MTPSANPTPHAAHNSPAPEIEPDVVDSIVHMMPVVLLLAGGVMMFLLAFIAVYLA